MQLNIPSPANPVRITGFQKFLVDFKYLLLEQVLEIRETWYWHIAFAIMLPVAFVFGFGRIGGENTSSAQLIYIISGSAIFTVANDGLFVMASRIGVMRRDGILIYYASLPISNSAFLISLMISRLLITLPGMIVPIIFGAWLYHIPLSFNLWILILLPIAGLALSSIGMALGILIENLEILHMITNILMFVLVMATPVFIPMDALPLPLQIFGYFMPPTYAAQALRSALLGTVDSVFYLNVAILSVMTIAGFLIVNRWLRIRVV